MQWSNNLIILGCRLAALCDSMLLYEGNSFPPHVGELVDQGDAPGSLLEEDCLVTTLPAGVLILDVDDPLDVKGDRRPASSALNLTSLLLLPSFSAPDSRVLKHFVPARSAAP